MECPKCKQELKPILDPMREFQDYQDVTFECENGHKYWARIKTEDLLEV